MISHWTRGNLIPVQPVDILENFECESNGNN